MNALLLALQLAALPAPPPDAGRESAARAWNQAERVILAFLTEWTAAWQNTELGQKPLEGTGGSDREAAVHCHWPPGPEDDYPEHNDLIGRIAIAGEARAHLSCPFWYPGNGARLRDERTGIDGGLAGLYRPTMRLRREELLRELRAAARRSPDDLRLTGQRVRFALDEGSLEQAWKIATSCRSDAVQCQLLRGLVLYRRQLVPEADSVFLEAARAMPERERCAWNDVGVLLEPALRSAYGATSCADRAALEARLWWLADPLYGEPGNERRAEHFARKVSVALVAQLPTDGRQHFERGTGGDAVIETLLRYGWPSHVYWGGPQSDQGHTDWLAEHGVAAATPYVAREYTRGRLHTVPPAAVLAAPFSATAEAWRVTDPGAESVWWPVEHFARDRGAIVELDGQGVFLRRAAEARFAWAGTLDSAALVRPAGSRVRAELFRWRSPTEGGLVGALAGQVGGRLVIDTVLAAGPVLIGIEVSGDRSAPAARTRFGAEVPGPLTGLGAGERAISQPLLFEPAADGADVAADEAVARMYARTSFAPGGRIGVYWEGYGFAAADTVDVEVRITGEVSPGAPTPIPESGGGVSQHWRDEPGAARAIQATEGTTPLQMRSIVLDISELAPGLYRVVIAMSSPRTGTVIGARTFRVTGGLRGAS